MEGPNNSVEGIEERISEFKDRITDITPQEEKQENRLQGKNL